MYVEGVIAAPGRAVRMGRLALTVVILGFLSCEKMLVRAGLHAPPGPFDPSSTTKGWERMISY
jgi:hypothetical protein